MFFRSIEHVDSCLKYYMDGIREFFIDTKSKKVHYGNVETNYFMSKRRDIDVEDMFYIVEYEYTDTKELSSSELLQEDYKKYSGMFPLTEKIGEQLVREE